MVDIIDIKGFRCVNFTPCRTTIASGRFNVDNPCSWCKRRTHKGRMNIAFHYVEYDYWEFPFIAEATCTNFSVIKLTDQTTIDPEIWQAVKTINEDRNRISEIGKRYARQWVALDSYQFHEFQGLKILPGQVLYPTLMTASDFFRQANDLRSDLFDFKLELKEHQTIIFKKLDVQNSRLADWLVNTTDLLKTLTRQIDDLESVRPEHPLSVVSRWSFQTIAGGVAWDTMKSLSHIIAGIGSGT